MDKFPEAFERFETYVDVDRFDSYMELLYAFQWWAGEKWIGSPRQWSAFNAEAERLEFEAPSFVREEIRDSQRPGYYVSEVRQKAASWRHEIVKVRGASQSRYRDIRTGRFIRKP